MYPYIYTYIHIYPYIQIWMVQSLKNSMANMDTTIQLLEENNARLTDYLNTQMKESKGLRDENDALKEQLRCDRSDLQSATVQMLSDKISELTNTILRMHSSEVTRAEVD